METDNNSGYSSGVSRVFWQLLLLVALVFIISFYYNYKAKEDNHSDRKDGYNMQISTVNLTSEISFNFQA